VFGGGGRSYIGRNVEFFGTDGCGFHSPGRRQLVAVRAGEHWSWHSAIYELSALTQHSSAGLKMWDHRNTHTHPFDCSFPGLPG